jgi:hypothetical protein
MTTRSAIPIACKRCSSIAYQCPILPRPQEAHVADSCIAHNYSTARDGAVVELARYNPYYLSAPDNWWGSAGGPSGAGPGSGDSVGDHVIFTKHKTAPPEGCPSGSAASVYLPVVEK